MLAVIRENKCVSVPVLARLHTLVECGVDVFDEHDARLGQARGDERLQRVVIQAEHSQREDVDRESEFARDAVDERCLSGPRHAVEQVATPEWNAYKRSDQV